jgi:hypothetical protein
VEDFGGHQERDHGVLGERFPGRQVSVSLDVKRAFPFRLYGRR